MATRVAAEPKTMMATTRKRNAVATKANPKTRAPKKPAKRPGPGRRSLYTPELSERICQHISGGGKVADLDDMHGMPASSTVWQWLSANDEFRSRYNAATELRRMRWSEDVVEIADKASADTVLVDKLRIDTRLRLMHKLTRPANGSSGEAGSTAALSAMSWEEKLDHACDLFRTLGILVEDDKGDQ